MFYHKHSTMITHYHINNTKIVCKSFWNIIWVLWFHSFSNIHGNEAQNPQRVFILLDVPSMGFLCARHFCVIHQTDKSRKWFLSLRRIHWDSKKGRRRYTEEDIFSRFDRTIESFSKGTQKMTILEWFIILVYSFVVWTWFNVRTNHC